MLEEQQSYNILHRDFRWHLPQFCNIAEQACEVWAKKAANQTAIIEWHSKGHMTATSYGTLSDKSNRFANVLTASGVSEGDRVALLLPQGVETAICHLAIYKMAAIADPLTLLFGRDALQYRLRTCGAKAIVTNAAGLEKINQIENRPDQLKTIFVDDDGDIESEIETVDFNKIIDKASSNFTIIKTGPDTPALMIFTSGTTGQPKGALHGHRVLHGHLPGVQMHHEFLPQPGDRLWTPADWAWAGGLLNILLPGLALGVPVVCSKIQKFDPQQAYELMADAKVRNVFIPPTALKLLKSINNPLKKYDLDLRTIGSGGESLGRETLAWAKQQLAITINEFYGQTECNLVLGSCGKIGVSRAGAIGKPVPGHEVAIINPDGSRCAVNEPGQIAVKRPDPVMFLEYWQNPQATTDKYVGDWLITGDQGICDDDGYVHFFGRDDDIITSSGYRIGPGEIEDSLLAHPAIALAVVVGKPDELRTEIIKAYVKLADGFQPSNDLVDEIRAHVRNRLSAHEYPREISFVDEIPLTTTGKVIRRTFRQMAADEVQS